TRPSLTINPADALRALPPANQRLLAAQRPPPASPASPGSPAPASCQPCSPRHQPVPAPRRPLTRVRRPAPGRGGLFVVVGPFTTFLCRGCSHHDKRRDGRTFRQPRVAQQPRGSLITQ